MNRQASPQEVIHGCQALVYIAQCLSVDLLEATYMQYREGKLIEPMERGASPSISAHVPQRGLSAWYSAVCFLPFLACNAALLIY